MSPSQTHGAEVITTRNQFTFRIMKKEQLTRTTYMYIVEHLVSVEPTTMKSIFPSNQKQLQLYKLSFAMAELEYFMSR